MIAFFIKKKKAVHFLVESNLRKIRTLQPHCTHAFCGYVAHSKRGGGALSRHDTSPFVTLRALRENPLRSKLSLSRT